MDLLSIVYPASACFTSFSTNSMDVSVLYCFICMYVRYGGYICIGVFRADNTPLDYSESAGNCVMYSIDAENHGGECD